MKIKNLIPKYINKIMKEEHQIFNKIVESKEVILNRIETFPKGCFGIFYNENLVGYITSEIWGKHNMVKLNVKASDNHNPKGKYSM